VIGGTKTLNHKDRGGFFLSCGRNWLQCNGEKRIALLLLFFVTTKIAMVAVLPKIAESEKQGLKRQLAQK
jgi:hypothetical protein